MPDATNPSPSPPRPRHPDSRWFSGAALGIWFDWGIDPSGAGAGAGAGAAATPEDALAAARRFSPDRYDPQAWLAPAAQAGCRYALLTARDATGYTLWPSHHGELGTHACLNGRDLVQTFIDAARKMGLRVGLHCATPRRDLATALTLRILDGQLDELLTRYGKLDAVSFDEAPPAAWVERIQQVHPGAVTLASGGAADAQRLAAGAAIQRSEGWWTQVQDLATAGEPDIRPLLVALVETRSRGGNLLMRCSPGPAGTVPEPYPQDMTDLRLWLGHSGESVMLARSGPWPDQSDIPVTTRGDTWYFHFTARSMREAQIDAVGRPTKAQLLRTGAAVPFDYLDGTLTLRPPEAKRTDLVDVVVAMGLTVAQR